MNHKELEHTLVAVILIIMTTLGTKYLLGWFGMPRFLEWLFAIIITLGLIWYIYNEGTE